MSVDQRVVEMKFNNRQFESGVKTSMSSLERLKSALNLDTASRSLSKLEAAGRSFSLSGIDSGVSALTDRFSTMGIVGFTVIQNLTNTAINAGKRMTKALTGPLVDGGIKRALNIEKAKFQFEGLGMDVEATMLSALEAVKGTAFGLDEAAVAASQFGATGMRAGEDMTSALRAISGVAAMTGSSYSDISQVFTTVAGNGRLMGTELLRLSSRGINAAATLATAFNMTEEQVRSMVSKGQISFEMFYKAMDGAFGEHATRANETYTGSLSNMRAALARIGAAIATPAFENLRKMFNALTPVIDSVHNAIKPLISSFSDAIAIVSQLTVKVLESLDLSSFGSSIPKVLDAIRNLVYGVSSILIVFADILEPIEQAFRDVFPPMTIQTLVDVTAKFRALMETFKIGEKTTENIRRTFRGLFAALDFAKQVIFVIAKSLGGLLKVIFPVAESLLYVTAIIGDFVYGLNNMLRSSDTLNVAFSKISKILAPIASVITNSIRAIVRALDDMIRIDTSGVESFFERLQLRFAPFTKLGGMVSAAIGGLVNMLKKSSPIFVKLADIIGGAFDNLRNALMKAFNSGDFNAIFDVLNKGLFATLLVGLNLFVNKLGNFITTAGGYGSRFKSILTGVRKSLEQYQNTLKANVLMKIALAIGILSVALVALSMVDSVKLTVALSAMTVMFVQLFGALTVFQKLMSGGMGFGAMTTLTLSLIGLSAAILLLSFAVTRLSKLDWNGLLKGLVGVAGLSAVLVGTAKLLEGTSVKLIRGSLGFILFGTALLVLTSAVKRLGEMDIQSLTKGLIGVGVLAAQIALFMKVADLKGIGLFKGLGFIALATAMLILANTVKKFSEIDTQGLTKGLVVLGLTLAQIAIFVKLTGDSKRVISTAIGLTILGAAMLIFASAVNKMGGMSWDTIGRGLVTMAGALAIVAGAMSIMPKGLIFKGTGLLLIATSLIVLSNALANMGGMSWSEMAKGLLTLAGALTIIAVAMGFMTTAIAGAAALLIIAGSLAILAPVLKLLGSMSLWEITKGLVALAGVFTILGLAGVVLGPLIPLILGVSAAMALMGVGVLALGAGILLFSAGVAALAVSGAAGAAALVLAISGIIGLIPFAAKSLAVGFIELVKTLAEGKMALSKALTEIIIVLIDAIVDITPKIVGALFTLVDMILKTLVKYTPKIVNAGYDIMINFMNAISKKVPELMDAGAHLVISFINGLADTIQSNTDPLLDAMENLVDVIIEATLKAFKRSITKFKDVGGDIVSGVTEGVRAAAGAPVRAVKGMANNMIESARSVLRIFSPSRIFRFFGNMVGVGLEKGVEESSGGAEEAAKKMTEAVVGETSSVVEKSNTAAKTAFQKSLEWIEERKYYNKLSLQEELEAWENIQAKYIAGSEERKRADREVYRLRNELIKEEWNNSRKWIDDRKYYQELSLQEELAAWERVHARYLEGSEERKTADRELFRVRMAMEREAYQNSIGWIEERKFYNDLALNAELAAWKRVSDAQVSLGRVDSDEWKKAQREIYTITNRLEKVNTDYNESVTSLNEQTNKQRIEMEKEYYDKTKSINDKLKNDIKSVTDAYESAVKTRAASLYSTYGMFEKVEVKEAVDGIDLVTNLKDQVIEFDAWKRSIQELAEKGVDEGLISELEKMGPKSIEQIKALNRLNKPMLDKYVHLWQTKHEETRKQSVRELEHLRLESISQVASLNAEATKELDEYRQNWSTRMSALVTDTIKQAKKLEKDWLEIIGETTSGTEKDFERMVGRLEHHLTKPDWSALGKDVIDGISAGVKSGAMQLARETVRAAMGALHATEEALGIKSPSKEFMKVGKYSIEGIVLGLTKFAGRVYNAGTDVGETAKEALRTALSNVAEIVSGDMDMVPTIRPVLDLSNVYDANREMSSIFGDRLFTADGRSLDLTRSIGSAKTEQASLLGLLPKLMDALGKTEKEPKTVTNEFNIDKVQVREEADVKKVARQLYQLQVAGNRG